MIALPDKVTTRTAGRELGLRPKEFELAVQQGEVRTVPGREGGPSRVTRAELERLRATRGFPHELRERIRVAGAGEGAALLGISPTRFARLAKGGCFSPVRFRVNRYGTVVWLYLVAELHAFAERRPELLAGRAPEGLRALLGSGVDHRPRHWRSRRVGQLVQQAHGPWERAAARAAVLDEEALRKAVPDPGERARLLSLRPELTAVPQEASVTREVAGELVLARDEDEALWHGLMLVADLEDARAAAPAPPPARVPGPEPAVERGGKATGGRAAARAPAQPAPSGPEPAGDPQPEPAVAQGAVRRRRFRGYGWFGARRGPGAPAARTARVARAARVSRPAF